jgi:hypothetical protein
MTHSLENVLADTFRPYYIFDDAEGARFTFNADFGAEIGVLTSEPVTLFQVRPKIRLSGAPSEVYRLKIRWLFLFRNDGGYGPGSYCDGFDSHSGDNSPGTYYLESNDGGVAWMITSAALGDDLNLAWPYRLNSSDRGRGSRLEVYDLTHPIVYMSAGKRHIYFTKDWDERQDSFYSDVPLLEDCNDDVNGLGDREFADLRQFRYWGRPYNNVGEPELFDPPSGEDVPPFVNKLYPFYNDWRYSYSQEYSEPIDPDSDGCQYRSNMKRLQEAWGVDLCNECGECVPGYQPSAWGDGPFYSVICGPNKNKWMGHEFQ